MYNENDITKLKEHKDWLIENEYNENGDTYIIAGGNTFRINSDLKMIGCYYDTYLRLWRRSKPIKLPYPFFLIKLSFFDTYYLDEDNKICLKSLYRSIVSNKIQNYQKIMSNSKHFGKNGEVYDSLKVRLFDYKFMAVGPSIISLRFEDEDGNIFLVRQKFSETGQTRKDIEKGLYTDFILSYGKIEHTYIGKIPVNHVINPLIIPAKEENPLIIPAK